MSLLYFVSYVLFKEMLERTIQQSKSNYFILIVLEEKLSMDTVFYKGLVCHEMQSR